MELELVKEDDDDDDGGDDDDDDENQLYQESFESRLRSVLWTQFLQVSPWKNRHGRKWEGRRVSPEVDVSLMFDLSGKISC